MSLPVSLVPWLLPIATSDRLCLYLADTREPAVQVKHWLDRARSLPASVSMVLAGCHQTGLVPTLAARLADRDPG